MAAIATIGRARSAGPAPAVAIANRSHRPRYAGTAVLTVILTTPDTQVARQSQTGRAGLNRLIGDFRQALTDRTSDPLPLAKRLHAILIGPIAADLAQAEAGTLMWSLDAALRYIPLAALHDGAHWLIEDHPLVLYTLAAREHLRIDSKTSGTDARSLSLCIGRFVVASAPLVSEP